MKAKERSEEGESERQGQKEGEGFILLFDSLEQILRSAFFYPFMAAIC
jgi:hypothetical protein